MSQKRSTNDIIEGLTHELVKVAKHGTKEHVEKAIEIMEEGWTKMDEVLGNTWFNKEVAKIWRESLKAKSETKNSTKK